MSEDAHSGRTGKGERLIKERRSGTERRKQTGDRRESFRFESDGRRDNEDRRKAANIWSKVPDASRRKD